MIRQRRADAYVASSLYAYLGANAEARRLEQRGRRLFMPGGVSVIAGLGAVLASRHPEIANALTTLQEDVANKAGYVAACLGLTAMVLGLRDNSQALGIRKAALYSVTPPLPPLPQFTPDTITGPEAAAMDGLAGYQPVVDPDQL